MALASGHNPLWLRPASVVLTGRAALAARRAGRGALLWTTRGRDSRRGLRIGPPPEQFGALVGR
jgi:hypothetical protein